MRSLLAVITACLALFIVGVAAASGSPPQSAAVGPSAAAPTTNPAPSGASAGSDDAAKHAKRTNCLKEAKAKKLVGAQKASFVKDCLGTP